MCVILLSSALGSVGDCQGNHQDAYWIDRAKTFRDGKVFCHSLSSIGAVTKTWHVIVCHRLTLSVPIWTLQRVGRNKSHRPDQLRLASYTKAICRTEKNARRTNGSSSENPAVTEYVSIADYKRCRKDEAI